MDIPIRAMLVFHAIQPEMTRYEATDYSMDIIYAGFQQLNMLWSNREEPRAGKGELHYFE